MPSKPKHIGQLKAAAKDVETRALTDKAKELQQQVVSDALARELTKEFGALGVADLEVSFRAIGQRGKTVFSLVLEKPGEQKLSRVLSEGEQRAIAIASFLADLNLSGSTAGIVFDDPVSSLDHMRRWNVVGRLVKEAAKRQVIVFTHDLYFLCLLQEESELKGVPCWIQSLHRTGEGYGVAEDTVPFDGAQTKERVKILRRALEEARALEKEGKFEASKEKIRNTYVALRKAWERGIEEVLFNNAVVRFRKGVETNRLGSVEVGDDDFKTINIGMTRCSNFPHDGAANANVPTPSLKELEDDINALEAWRSETAKRLDVVKRRRGA